MKALFKTSLDLFSICLVHFTMLWNSYVVWRKLTGMFKTSLDLSTFVWRKLTGLFKTSLDLSSFVSRYTEDKFGLVDFCMTDFGCFSISLRHFTIQNRYNAKLKVHHRCFFRLWSKINKKIKKKIKLKSNKRNLKEIKIKWKEI